MRRFRTRVLLGASLALGVSILSAPGSARAEAPQVRTQAAGYYRMFLGAFEVTALLDGTHPFPIPSVLVAGRPGPGGARELLSDAKPGEAEARLTAVGLAMPFEGSINAFLINTGEKLVLIDAGAGELYGSCCGKLVSNLRAAGYSPEQVDEVLLTHLHADHVGGVMTGGRPTFPNATLRVSRRDADYWLNPANEAGAPAILLPMFRGAQKVLRPYIDAGRFQPFEDGADIMPGIRPIPTPGHTPGHRSYRVTSGTETMIVWGDIVHVSPIQFPDPSVTVTYDSDGLSAEATRVAIFAEAAQKHFWIGAGHVRQRGGNCGGD